MYIHRYAVVVPLKLHPTRRFIAESLFQLETREVYNVVDDDPEDEVRSCCSFIRGTAQQQQQRTSRAGLLLHMLQESLALCIRCAPRCRHRAAAAARAMARRHALSQL